jgi:GTP-binding protein EngB required for normal cell division
MMSEDLMNENQVVHILDQQQFKLKDMKKVKIDETMTSTMNEINMSMIDVALKVDKLKRCV